MSDQTNTAEKSRHLTIRDGLTGIETKTEGMDHITFSAMVYNTPLREYIPLANGFNLELANAVYDQIKDKERTWVQSDWRAMDIYDYDYDKGMRTEVDKISALELSQAEPACGTSMCVAGWAAEMTHADWVIDGSWVRKVNAAQDTTVEHDSVDVEMWVDRVLVPIDEDTTGWDRWTELPVALHQDLVKRGFSPTTYAIIPVAHAARKLMGIGDDLLGLFGAGNNIDMIREIIDGYTKFGAHLTSDQAHEYLKNAKYCSLANACGCPDCYRPDEDEA